MTGVEMLEFIRPEIMVLVPVLIIIGLMLKKVSQIRDWTIPIVLGVIGIVLAIAILSFEEGFTGPTILNGIIQGILAAGMAVYVHQLTIQFNKKRLEDDLPPSDALE